MNPVVAFRAAVLVGLAAPAILFAQSRFDNTVIPLEFLETSPWTVSAGARFSTEGAKVNFGQLGIVSSTRSAPPAGAGNVDRSYDNGGVGVDAPRQNERDAAGNVFSTPFGRYQGRTVDNAGNEDFIGDYVSYTEGRSRNWGANSASQISNGELALSLFSTQSGGATAQSDKTASGGFEVSTSRRLWRPNRRIEVGVSGLFALNDINAGTRGSVQTDLVTTTDYYRLHGAPPAADAFPYSGPSFTNTTTETTSPVDQLPFDRKIVTTVNGATILGSWKINGAYYVVRAGPVLRVFITEKLALSFEGGFAAAFVGTDYEVRETLELAGLPQPITVTQEEEETAVLAGFYGSGAVEYWMTDRTNAYAGAAYESLDSYQQSVGGRTADIDIGSTVTVRLGLTTRF